MEKIWNLRIFEKKEAMIDRHGNRLTYLDLDNEGKKIIELIGRRCLIFLLCENSIGSLLGYSAFINNDIVPALLNKHLDIELLNNLLEAYQPSYIWAPQSTLKQLYTMKSGKELEAVYEAYGYTLLKTNYEIKYEIFPELALLLTTSGSTGSPKFVRQSYTNVRDNAKSIADYLELDTDEKPITTLPMNYTYGLSIINSHFLVGATLLLTDCGIMQMEFWKFFKDNGATSFGGVPYTYEILEKLHFRNMELPTLKTFTQAGGKLTPKLHKKYAEYAQANNKKFIVMYGACEATARMGYLPSNMALEKCGSMGVAIPGGKFQLEDGNGKIMASPYVTGELVYRGTNVSLGYAECSKDLSKRDERKGILYTGDMAQMDKDGYYYIVGRKKRFLKIYGNRVNLDEIERLIKGYFEGIECASAGVDDHIYVFLTNAEKEKSVKDFIVEKTGLNRIAFTIMLIDAIPKNDSGKILYNELAKYYE